MEVVSKREAQGLTLGVLGNAFGVILGEGLGPVDTLEVPGTAFGGTCGLVVADMLGDAPGEACGEALGLGSTGIGGILGAGSGEPMVLSEPAWWVDLSLVAVLWSSLRFSLAGIMECVAVVGPRSP